MRQLGWTLVILGLAGAAAPQDFARYEVQRHPLGPSVALLQGAGGNLLACTAPQGVLLVDTDFVEMSEKTVAAAAALGAGPVRLVVNTHWHYDHAGGNARLAELGAVILAHARSREYMASPQHLDVVDTDVAASPAVALPAIGVRDSLVIHWGDEEIALYPVAGHTGGDLVVHLRTSDVVHAGDLFFNCGYPYIDTAHGGSIDGLIAGVQFVLGLCGPETRIVPGHGPAAGVDELRTYLGIVSEYRRIVAAEIAAGRTLAELIAARPAAALDAEWGSRMFTPEAFLTMIWLSLAGAGP